MNRILIFELNWLGDILFSFPFLRALREKFPDAYISCVTVPRYSDLLVHNPWINDVHVLSDDNSVTSIMGKLAFIKMIRRERYDACFLLKPSVTKTLMAEFAGIHERIGFAGKKAPLTRIVEMPPPTLHRADTILALAGAVGVTKADGAYEYFFNEEDKARAEHLLSKAGGGVQRMVAINPGGNWDAKRWPAKNFIHFAKMLLDNFDDIEIAVTGAEKDIELTNNIVQQVGPERCYTLAGETGLNELAVIFKKCDLVVSADSGPLHLASATGTATIGLFGPTSPDITGPRGKGRNIVISKHVDCEVPCYVEECDKNYECMEQITVEEVIEAAKRLLG